eukprot:TRINITY_DN5514_c0_g1_i1.p1 TRINITY_DN5514_c0_g1~~TRINITY_DN5514_c0_g1_i1.p1  ORF type:complete len:503 (+),score=124.92 TRINITY_DN5514_c0_g1_i1:445-1953(+)
MLTKTQIKLAESVHEFIKHKGAPRNQATSLRIMEENNDLYESGLLKEADVLARKAGMQSGLIPPFTKEKNKPMFDNGSGRDCFKAYPGDSLHILELGVLGEIVDTAHGAIVHGVNNIDGSKRLTSTGQLMGELPPFRFSGSSWKNFDKPLSQYFQVEGKHNSIYLHNMMFVLIEHGKKLIPDDSIRNKLVNLLRLARMVLCLAKQHKVNAFSCLAMKYFTRKLYVAFCEFNAILLGKDFVRKTTKWHILVCHYHEIMKQFGPFYLGSSAAFEGAHVKNLKRPFKNTNKHSDSLEQVTRNQYLLFVCSLILDDCDNDENNATVDDDCDEKSLIDGVMKKSKKMKISALFGNVDCDKFVRHEILMNGVLDIDKDTIVDVSDWVTINIQHDPSRNGSCGFDLKSGAFVKLLPEAGEGIHVAKVVRMFKQLDCDDIMAVVVNCRREFVKEWGLPRYSLLDSVSVVNTTSIERLLPVALEKNSSSVLSRAEVIFTYNGIEHTLVVRV